MKKIICALTLVLYASSAMAQTTYYVGNNGYVTETTYTTYAQPTVTRQVYTTYTPTTIVQQPVATTTYYEDTSIGSSILAGLATIFVGALVYDGIKHHDKKHSAPAVIKHNPGHKSVSHSSSHHSSSGHHSGGKHKH